MTARSEPIRLLLVEDEPLFREALRERLAQVPSFQVVGEAGDINEALARLPSALPHLAVIDIGLKKRNGLLLVREMQKRCPEVHVIICSVHSNASYFAEAKAAGVRGYVLKTCPSAEIVNAIEVVAGGGYYCSADVEQVADAAPRLTLSEMRILKLVVGGKKSKEIAKQLKLSCRTVETHRCSIMNKLGATSPAHLVIIAYRLGLLDLLE